MTPPVLAVLITLAIGGPIALWLGSQRRVDRAYVRRMVSTYRLGVVEVYDVIARPPAPAIWVLRDGRICAAGSGARDVSAAPAPAASHPTAALWVRDGRICAADSGVRGVSGRATVPAAPGQLGTSPDQLAVVGAGAEGSTSRRALASTTRTGPQTVTDAGISTPPEASASVTLHREAP